MQPHEATAQFKAAINSIELRVEHIFGVEPLKTRALVSIGGASYGRGSPA